MNWKNFKFFLPIFASLYLVGSLVASNANAQNQVNSFSFPSCEALLNTPGDHATYDFGLHQIVGGPLLPGADDVYSVDEGNYVQCFCPVEGTKGIQTNWLRTEEPIDGWFFENGLQWNLGNYTYAAQNIDFSCAGEPEVGGPSSSVSGNISTPQCPQITPQPVDQVWFSNITGKG